MKIDLSVPHVDMTVCDETACFYLAQNTSQILSTLLSLCFIVLVINESLFLEFVIFFFNY